MGSDVLFNLVQWAFFVVSIVESGVVAWVASREPAAGLLAAAFVASLPMAILQASSSQNDLVVSGYALGAALAVVAARQRETERERRWLVVLAGACLGLACLSKGTGYLLTVILLPAGVIAAGKGGRRGWVMAVAIVLVLNTPHLVRNARRFGDVAPHPEGVTWSAWTGRGVAGRMGSQVWRAAVLQIQPAMRVPASAAVIERATDAVHRVLGVSAQDPRVTWTGSVPFLRRLSPLHEDTAGNPVHFALALVAAVATLARRRREAVVAFLFATGWLAWLVLALAVKWMPWQSRLQLPALVLLAAPAGAWLAARVAPSHRPAMAAVVGLALLATGVPWLVLNASRPLVGIPGRAPSILSRTRWENFFRNRPELQHDVEGLTAALPAECSPTRPVGLHVGGGQWEYALWAGADRARRRLVFEHVPAGDPPRADLCAVVSDRCPAAALCLESP
jgi:hypothetical protein